jgi:hypothetical protein
MAGPRKKKKTVKKTASKKTTKKKDDEGPIKRIEVPRPAFIERVFTVVGTQPYVQHNFGAKAREEIRKKQEMGDKKANSTRKVREPKDFKKLYEEAMYKSPAGWYGQPAAAYRAGMVEAAGQLGKFKKAAKRAIFIEADGYAKPTKGEACGIPLVKMHKAKPKMDVRPVRLADINRTADLRSRPLFDEGWEVKLRVRFDSDVFSEEDILYLLVKAGYLGIGEGRNDSPKGYGMNWGSYTVKDFK